MTDQQPDEMTTTVSHVVPVSLKQWIKDQAAQRGISASEVVRQALEAARSAQVKEAA
jgi:Arc/MetJ-type ribon-helix-helix transcriptional regulator